jgi:hypothetical protein
MLDDDNDKPVYIQHVSVIYSPILAIDRILLGTCHLVHPVKTTFCFV